MVGHPRPAATTFGRLGTIAVQTHLLWPRSTSISIVSPTRSLSPLDQSNASTAVALTRSGSLPPPNPHSAFATLAATSHRVRSWEASGRRPVPVARSSPPASATLYRGGHRTAHPSIPKADIEECSVMASWRPIRPFQATSPSVEVRRSTRCASYRNDRSEHSRCHADTPREVRRCL